MKKYLPFFAIVLFVFTNLNAQSAFRLGAKAGVNFASIGGDFTNDTRGLVRFHIGGLTEIPLFNNFSIQPEILYSAQGSKRDTRATDGPLVETNLNYINIPVVAKYYFTNNFSIMAGPQVGVLVTAKNEITPSGFGGNAEISETDIKDDIRALDVGVGIGAEYRLPFGIFAQVRYVFGLSNVNDNSEDKVLGYYYFPDVKNHNNVFQISAGYSF